MKITQFDAPGKNGDFTGNAALAAKWSSQMSKDFDQGVADVNAKLAAHGGGTSQFYNPLTHGPIKMCFNETPPDRPFPSGLSSHSKQVSCKAMLLVVVRLRGSSFAARVRGAIVSRKPFVELHLKMPRHFIQRSISGPLDWVKHPSAF